jgi:hypothetical protein
LQLLFGKLNLPIEALRIIEESSSNPDEMQTNMGYVDECGNPSTNSCFHDMNVKSTCSPSSLAASADECARAAEIYECGKKKAPSLTNAIQQQLTSDRSSPPAVMLNYKIYFLISQIICLGEHHHVPK